MDFEIGKIVGASYKVVRSTWMREEGIYISGSIQSKSKVFMLAIVFTLIHVSNFIHSLQVKAEH